MTQAKDISKLVLKGTEAAMSSGPFLREVGELLVASVQENFEQGGRYLRSDSLKGGSKKWKPVSGEYAREKTKRKKNPKNLLLFTGRLRQSVTYRIVAGDVYIGSNVAYAAAHQFGAEIQVPAYTRKVRFKPVKKNGRTVYQFAKNSDKGDAIIEREIKYPSVTMTLPARPFIVVQESDNEEIGLVALRYIPKYL